MTKIFIALIAASAALAAMPLTNADSSSGTYVGASPGLVAVTGSFTELAIAGSNFGGYTFAHTGAAPTTVTVEDATGNPVYFSVCQDLDDDSVCGEAADGITQLTDEPQVYGCGAPADLTSGGFSPAFDTLVFVWSTDLPGTACIGTATTGTITIDYA